MLLARDEALTTKLVIHVNVTGIIQQRRRLGQRVDVEQTVISFGLLELSLGMDWDRTRHGLLNFTPELGRVDGFTGILPPETPHQGNVACGVDRVRRALMTRAPKPMQFDTG